MSFSSCFNRGMNYRKIKKIISIETPPCYFFYNFSDTDIVVILLWGTV